MILFYSQTRSMQKFSIFAASKTLFLTVFCVCKTFSFATVKNRRFFTCPEHSMFEGLKNKLSLFPDLENIFELNDGNSSRDVKVESYPCTCRGPDQPMNIIL